jgi:opine dehydrogenase
MAGHLGLMGFDVSLWGRSSHRVAPVAARGGVQLEGKVEGFGPVRHATNFLPSALATGDVVMVVLPASAHRELALRCAPHLRDGQIVLLNPGRTGGALEFAHVLRMAGCRADVLVAEAQTFLYASRATGPANARIFEIKRQVTAAALPSWRTQELLDAVTPAFPQFVGADSVLETSLDNMGAILHPGLTILNTARIEATGGMFDYYHEGMTPAVARVLEAMDEERCAVGHALGVRVVTAREWLAQAYGAEGSTLYEAVRNNKAYAGIKAPDTIQHRYIWEDVPASLVPIATLGEMLGVPTPAIRNIIQMASLLHDTDYWALGRTAQRLGIAGMDAATIRAFVRGEVDACADVSSLDAPSATASTWAAS